MARLSLLIILLWSTALLAAPLAPDQVQALLTRVVARTQTGADFQSQVVIQTVDAEKGERVLTAQVFRRDSSDQFLFLVTAPKRDAGKGYLKVDDNLWSYDPATGKWERRTEREGLVGTDARRADLEPLDLLKDFTAVYVAEETLGRFAVHHLRLTAKAGVQVPYPVLDQWYDQATDDLLKQQEHAQSGRLARTVLTPRWARQPRPDGLPFSYPESLRIFDEIETQNRTTVQVERISLSPLPPNLFTKAWLESQSR